MPIFTKVNDPAGDKWVEVGANESGGGGGSSWGEFTTNGDETDSGTYKDGVGREWKWASFSDRSQIANVTVSGGLYKVLCASGGVNGNYASGASWNGGGAVVEGNYELDAGVYEATVGERFWWGIPSDTGVPKTGSSLLKNGVGPASPLNSFPFDSNHEKGAAAPFRSDGDDNAGRPRFNGFLSSITGTLTEYGAVKNVGVNPSGIPVSFGSFTQDGCVIIATVTNDPSDWNPPGQIPGLGGWATVQSITGSAGTRYTYNDGVMDWVAYEFTDDGTLTKSEGLADVLLISGGSGYHSQWANGGDLDVQPGGGGDAVSGIHNVGLGALTVTVGSGGPANNYPWGTPGAASVLGSLETRCGRLYGMNSNGLNDPITSSITGVSETYAEGGFSKPSSSGRGDGAKSSGQSGTSGIVVIRVPAANAKATLPDTGWVDA